MVGIRLSDLGWLLACRVDHTVPPKWECPLRCPLYTSVVPPLAQPGNLPASGSHEPLAATLIWVLISVSLMNTALLLWLTR